MKEGCMLHRKNMTKIAGSRKVFTFVSDNEFVLHNNNSFEVLYTVLNANARAQFPCNDH